MTSLLTSDEGPFVFGAYVAHLNQRPNQPVDVDDQSAPAVDEEPAPAVLDSLLG